MQPETNPDMKTYLVLRSFHLGEITQNLTQGDRLQFDGSNLVYRGKSYNAPSLQRAVTAKLLTEDDGTQTVSKPPVAEKPKPKIVVENLENNIVGRVRVNPDHLPDLGLTAAKVVRASEETARITAENAPRKVVVDGQRVVGRAGKAAYDEAHAGAQPQTARAAGPSAAEQAEQAKNSTVIRPVVRDRAQQLLEAEGVVVRPGVKVVADQSEGVVISKVKSQEQREREAASASSSRLAMARDENTRTPEEEEVFQKDLALALAKRAGKAPIGAKAPADPAPAAPTPQAKTASAGDGMPDGYPQYNRFPDRVKWIQDRLADNPDVGTEDAKTIYRLSNDRFKEHLRASIDGVDFE